MIVAGITVGALLLVAVVIFFYTLAIYKDLLKKIESLLGRYSTYTANETRMQLTKEIAGHIREFFEDRIDLREEMDKELTMYAGHTVPVTLPVEQAITLAIATAQDKGKIVALLVDQLGDVRDYLKVIEKDSRRSEVEQVRRASGDVRIKYYGGGEILFAVLAPPRGQNWDLSIRVDKDADR